jgi:hypothetical protein
MRHLVDIREMKSGYVTDYDSNNFTGRYNMRGVAI